MIFVSHYNAPIVLKSGKQPLNFPPATIWPKFASILGLGFLSPPSMWGNHFNIALIKQSLVKLVAVIGFIPYKLIGCIFGKAAVNGGLDQFYFVRRSAFNVSGDRNTRSVCDCHDLGALATLCLADSKTPFFAGAKLPSIKASRISIWPRSCRSATSSCAIRLKTPCFTHCWNHLWHVWYGGYRWGISFHGAPVRKIQSIPLKTCRRSFAGRPLGSLAGVNSLIIGSIRFHCSFVISISIILHNQRVMSRFICSIFNPFNDRSLSCNNKRLWSKLLPSIGAYLF